MELERVDLHFYVYSSGAGNLAVMIAFRLYVTLLRFIIQHWVWLTRQKKDLEQFFLYRTGKAYESEVKNHNKYVVFFIKKKIQTPIPQ